MGIGFFFERLDNEEIYIGNGFFGKGWIIGINRRRSDGRG